MNSISNSLKRRFVKDYQLPIQLVQEPYFSYFLDLYQPLLGTRNAFHTFLHTLHQFENEEQFFVHARNFSESIIQHVNSKEAYQNFSNFDMNTFKPKHSIGQQKLYQQSNADNRFISIDLKKANFQALKFVNPELVDSKGSYEEFVTSVVPHSFDYFYNSKQIRQVIFGNLNPKRQQKIQKYLMATILDALLEAGLEETAVFSSSADELVVSDNKEEIVIGKGVSKNEIENALKTNEITQMLDLHIEDFLLEQVHPDFSFFVKNHSNGKKEFKNVPVFNMAEVYKYYQNMELEENDLAFFHEGRVAHFKTSIFD